MINRSTVVLKLEKLTKSYGKSRGVEDISLEIQSGEVFGFLGPNGAGKSTTINTILDLLRADSGSISIFGLDSHKDSVAIRRRVGYLSGDMATDPTLTGAQYLRYASHLHGGIADSQVAELVRRLHCETGKRIKALSRGNRQKIGLVATLMHDPELLILDEPTSGLDPLVQSEFNQIIRERQHAGKTTFMSSHILSEIQTICDRVGFIRDGKLIRVSRLDELLNDSPRRVSVLYGSAPPDSQLKTADGISKLKSNGNRREFVFRGNYNELIRIIGSKPIKDLQIVEPPLDELFMEYYQSTETSHV